MAVTIVTRAGAGVQLTWDQIDSNFTNLNTAVVIPGGTTGQTLIKSSNSDYDFIWANSSASSPNITIGTTSIVGGTSGYILYNNSGVLGNLATTGSGNVVRATSPTFVTPILGTPTSGTLTNCTGYSATNITGTLAVANGGTGVTVSSGASSVVLRDANQNITGNSFYQNLTTTTASGTTVNMTAASSPDYVVNGSGGQTIVLPDATTLPINAIFTFNNNQSSGTIVVKVFGSGSTVSTVQSGSYVKIILLTNGTSAGTWEAHYLIPTNASWSTNTLSWAGSITSATWNGVTVGVLYGGTGTTTSTGTAGSVVLSNTPTLVTPVLGAATGTSLALNGATLGTNALSVNGTALIYSSLLVGNTTVPSDLTTNSVQTTSGVFKSSTMTTASTASGTAVTIFAIPTNNNGLYLIQATLSGVNSVSNYGTVGYLIINGTTSKWVYINQGTLMAVTISGSNLQATQTSGASQVITATATRFA